MMWLWLAILVSPSSSSNWRREPRKPLEDNSFCNADSHVPNEKYYTKLKEAFNRIRNNHNKLSVTFDDKMQQIALECLNKGKIFSEMCQGLEYFIPDADSVVTMAAVQFHDALKKSGTWFGCACRSHYTYGGDQYILTVSCAFSKPWVPENHQICHDGVKYTFERETGYYTVKLPFGNFTWDTFGGAGPISVQWDPTLSLEKIIDILGLIC